MNEFIEISREDFESQQAFWPVRANFAYKTVSILASATSRIEYEKGTTELRHLPRFVGERSSGNAVAAAADPSAILRLVAVKSEVDTQSNWLPKLWITKEAFLGLVNSMGMHYGVLWLLRHQYDGFHAFRSTASPGSRTYYIGTSRFALMWAFHPSTTQTHAILIVRREIAGEPVENIADMLRKHGRYVYSPFLLAYVCSLSLGRNFDVELESEQLSNLRSMEKYTGYGPDQTKVRGRNDIDYLTTSLQWIGEILNHVANKERHIRMLYTVLDVIGDGMGNDDIPQVSRDRILEATDKLIAAIPPMKCRIDATQEYLKYLKERSERLSTVLLAMLTHEDATINLELADSNRRIAEAAQRDSSAMKTIAIMTMAFLPATFLAAVFAIPSLDWDSDDGGDVVKGNHWVYWAFALPFTSLVFIVWLLLDNRTAILDIFRITRTNTKIPA